MPEHEPTEQTGSSRPAGAGEASNGSVENELDVPETGATGIGPPASGETLEDDASEILGLSSRAFTEIPDESIGRPPPDSGAFDAEAEGDAPLDTEWDESTAGKSAGAASAGALPWDREVSAQRIAGELRRIEGEIRRLLEDHDTRRKRKLAGTRRWNELEEDIIQWRFSGRINDDLLRQVHTLVMRRHHLFNRLRFLATTRPTWNS